MRIIEENKLKEIVELINKNIEENPNINKLYNNLENMSVLSLQSLSLQEDYVFFDEVSFILSVITSIISHPHLSNRGEDIIIRAELAGNISADAFNQVVKEPMLWKEKDVEMVPEHVHYFQYTDELKIYENIFIVKLIDILSLEMAKYQSFYISLIPTLDASLNIIEMKELEYALNKIENLNKRLVFIKNTYFYKEVLKAKLTFKNIHGTNILLKDKLYNYCFKFYRKFIKYEDQQSILKDLRLYFFILLLKVFKKNNFEYVTKDNNELNNLEFKYKDYNLLVEYNELKQNIILTVRNNGIIAKHQLLLNLERINNEFVANCDDFTSTYISSIWHLNNYNNLALEASVSNSEFELMQTWVLSHMKEITGTKNIFSKYCPICTSRNVSMNKDGIYFCNACNSKYTFKTKNTIWFIDVRR